MGIEDSLPLPENLTPPQVVEAQVVEVERANAYANHLRRIESYCQEALLWAQAWQKYYTRQAARTSSFVPSEEPGIADCEKYSDDPSV